jgi:hypothetical protein
MRRKLEGGANVNHDDHHSNYCGSYVALWLEIGHKLTRKLPLYRGETVMKKFIRRLGTAVIPATAALALSALIPAQADRPTTSPPRQDTGTATINCNQDGGDLGATVTWSPTILWPPNHALVPITISHSDVGDTGNAIKIKVDAITSSQGSASTGVGGTGTGQENVSAAVVTVGLTAERNGNDPTGNVYTIDVTCSEPAEGESQSVALHVLVPHDQGQ